MYLGLILKKQGKYEAAAKLIEELVQHEPEKLDMHLHLAEARVELGQFDKAEAGYRRVMKLAPDQLAAPLGLAWSLATRANTTAEEKAEAVSLAEHVLDRTGGNSVRALDVMAAACASAGRFGEARSYADHAISLAKNQQDTELAKAIAERRLLYSESKPYHLPVTQGK